MNGGNNETDDVHTMAQVMSQQQQPQVDDDIATASFPQHLGQLPNSGVDQLTVRHGFFLLRYPLLS